MAGPPHATPNEQKARMQSELHTMSAKRSREVEEEAERRKTTLIYFLFLISFFTVQLGHGMNIGVAVSLPLDGSSRAMNLALGSWVMVGVCLGLPITPWACRTFGVFNVCSVCVLIDFLVILMMMLPGISLPQIYLVRFLVGFFEAPFLPYLQEWLSHWGKHSWNVWNTVLHAMVPLGENVGYILAQELVAAGFSWRWAFGGQAVILAVATIACYWAGGRKYLELSSDKAHSFEDDPPGEAKGSADGSPTSDDLGAPDSEVEYPVTERWVVYWAVNASLAAQLGFLGGIKYVIRDYATRGMGYSLNFTLFTFSSIALIGPALGGSVAMSGGVVRPDKWSQHRRTLTFLACCSSVAASVAVMLPYLPDTFFWPALFVAFTAAGGVYPAAQGIINIALTASRVIEASVYQVQCNNILFAMPMPYVIGKTMDTFGYETSFHLVVCLQILAAAGFVFATVAATFSEERSTWHRLIDGRRELGETSDVEMTPNDDCSDRRSQANESDHEKNRRFGIAQE